LFVDTQSHEESRHHWKELLHDAEPSLFPALAEPQCDESAGVGDKTDTAQVVGLDMDAIHAFCQDWEITIATVVQAAWGMVISRYTGLKTTYFGSLTSGRDLPIDGIEGIVGPLINLLTCRVDFVNGKTVLDTLKAMQENYVKSLEHQAFALYEVHRLLGLEGKGLFNTIFTLRHLDATEVASSSDLMCRLIDESDPTDVSLSPPFS
jgi:hypothetical protein